MLIVVGRTPINRQLACCDSVLVSLLIFSDSESESLYVANFDGSRCCRSNLTFCPTLECVIEHAVVVVIVVIVVIACCCCCYCCCSCCCWVAYKYKFEHLYELICLIFHLAPSLTKTHWQTSSRTHTHTRRDRGRGKWHATVAHAHTLGTQCVHNAIFKHSCLAHLLHMSCHTYSYITHTPWCTAVWLFF